MRPIDAVRSFLAECGCAGSVIYAALSGGADSVCLLDCLVQLRDAFALDVRAIHIQHGLRGSESDRDEQFCRTLCDTLGVPLAVETCDVRGYADKHRCSVETAARECRYAVFAKYCGDAYAATAHTASDQLETLLFRMARGTGLRGLCGIPPVRGRILRPLLQVTRAEVEEMLRERGLPHVTDSTNLEDGCSRNLLRHHAVPAMRQCNAAAEHNAAALAQYLRQDEDFLAAQAAQAYDACMQEDGSLLGLAKLHPAMQSRCIARFLQENDMPSGAYAIEAVRQLLERGGTLELVRGGRKLRAGRGCLFAEMPVDGVRRCTLRPGENRIFPSAIVRAERIDRSDAEKFARIHTMFANSVLDYGIIKGCAELHSRMPGLYLQGKNHRIRIKKWLGESVAPAKRQLVHYLSDEEGLLWVEGLGAAARAAVTPETETMLFLRIYHETNTEATPRLHADEV